MKEQADVAQLLKPRYKVIADWPGMKDMSVGEIITMNGRWPDPDSTIYWKYSVTDCQGTREYTTMYFEKWPHLFKKLDWSEDRDIAVLPAYIKSMDSKVYKVVKYRLGNGKAIARITDDFWKTEVWQELGYPFWMPATLTEYQNYLKSKQ